MDDSTVLSIRPTASTSISPRTKNYASGTTTDWRGKASLRPAEEHVEFLRVLGDVLTEVCYHLDVNDVLPPGITQACQDVMSAAVRRLSARPSAELLLLTYLDRRIEQLIAEPDDSRNTGAEGVTAPNRAAGP